jgi:hypothetical protein
MEEKRSHMRDVQRSYGEALTLVAVRMFPVVDPADGRIKPFDNWMRQFARENGMMENAPIGRDPVGVAFDMLIGRYTPNQFVADHFGIGEGSSRTYDKGIRVVETYPGPEGGRWSKVETSAGDTLYRDPQGNLHRGAGGPVVSTTPEVTSEGHSGGKVYTWYKDPITGNKWMTTRPEPPPEKDWRTVKTEQGPGYTTERKIYGTEQEAAAVRRQESLQQGNENLRRDLSNAAQTAQGAAQHATDSAGKVANDFGKAASGAINNFFGGNKNGKK